MGDPSPPHRPPWPGQGPSVLPMTLSPACVLHPTGWRWGGKWSPPWGHQHKLDRMCLAAGGGGLSPPPRISQKISNPHPATWGPRTGPGPQMADFRVGQAIGKFGYVFLDMKLTFSKPVPSSGHHPLPPQSTAWGLTCAPVS